MSKDKQIEKKECKKCLHYEMCLDNFRGAKEEGFYELTSEEEYFSHADECDFCAVGYRKQSENVIELPCKPGTILYFLYNSPYADKPDLTPRIYKTDDWKFEVDKTGIVITTSDIHSFNKKYDYYLGEAVFLTQEEAEQALEKMKGGAA